MKLAILRIAIPLFWLSLHATDPQTFIQAKNEHFISAKNEVERRWGEFQNHRTFKPFEFGRFDADLKDEFEDIQQTRQSIWTSPDYELGQHLILEDRVRAKNCVAFGFNNTYPKYNASTIFLGDHVYIACEGPRSKDIPHFFHFLTSYRLTHLVRLTDSYEGEVKKCHPYWEGVLGESQEGGLHLNIPTETGIYSLRAYDIAHWKDNQGIEPDQLLSVVLQVRKSLRENQGFLVVHCSAGVGRTGTFLAAMAIVDAIDHGAPFSIEEIVYRLSLQRIHAVSRLSQYTTLYRLADLYKMRIDHE